MNDNSQPKVSFDEFKLYYESTEKVTDRRLDTNRWNYSICIGILVAAAVLFKSSFSTKALLGVGFAGVEVLCLMALMFCMLWVKQIRDFKNLNTAKFGVLSEMAPLVDFNLEKPGTVLSFRPFDREWKKVEELNGLQSSRKGKIPALKSTNMEYFIPRAFATLFLGIFLTVMVIALLNWPPTNLVHETAVPPFSHSTGGR